VLMVIGITLATNPRSGFSARETQLSSRSLPQSTPTNWIKSVCQVSKFWDGRPYHALPSATSSAWCMSPHENPIDIVTYARDSLMRDDVDSQMVIEKERRGSNDAYAVRTDDSGKIWVFYAGQAYLPGDPNWVPSAHQLDLSPLKQFGFVIHTAQG
jgi:hypothetical protein